MSLKNNFIPLIALMILFSACQKEFNVASPVVAEACSVKIDNPAGRTYPSDSLVPFFYTKKHCGIMPLNKSNYWVYQDSIFNNGVFAKVQNDTFHFISTWRSFPDSLVWWETSLQIGLPQKLFATDSSFFEIETDLLPGLVTARKSFGLFQGDSIHYLTSFGDIAAFGRAIKLQSALKTSAGNFSDCILFEKNSPRYRKEQVFFKPELGVIKYIVETVTQGSSVLQQQQVSTLVAFHFE